MRDLPAGVDETALRRGLRAWGVAAVRLDYAPLGFGDYHWRVTDTGGRHWFLTVSDLARKPHCGDGPRAAYEGLRGALDTAGALRAAGLDFVVAPLPGRDGSTVQRMDGRYGLSLQPWVDGSAGEFGQRLGAAERARVMRTLAALHRAVAPATARTLAPGLPSRSGWESVPPGTDSDPEVGPRTAAARALLRRHGTALRRRLAEFDRLVGEVSARADAPVVTHGEPHPGNLLWGPDGEVRLIDWDTCGRSFPERDLWHVAAREEGGFDHEALSVWAVESGRTPDPSALELYRLRWDLDDVSAFWELFRAPHGHCADTEAAWEGLTGTVARLVNGPG
ncbi:phosphotransferase [Streptomyces sp. NPDC002490]|uniref:phosphotransferase enzyme family protein n=1 Tax=Streptomyces sp. NPDC002490 TaxID=3154416 RepID=UPI00332D3DF6